MSAVRDGARVLDRRTGEIYREKQVSRGSLGFLYGNPAGRALLKLIFSRRFFSKLFALRYDGGRSVKRIAPFIAEFGIDMSCCESREFKSFNDFFTRCPLPESRPVCAGDNEIAAPADSKMSVYRIDEALKMSIKGVEYTVEELLRDAALAREFSGGSCLVFRLTVDNIHRYAWCADGTILRERTIDGRLHSVGPMSEGAVKALGENRREYSVFVSDGIGKAVCMEVGALTVGKIVNNHRPEFRKGDEKGFFSYGGSTIILLFRRSAVETDADIAANSACGIETAVLMGEKIGVKAGSLT